jgi:ABC-type uncharacterized transport system ATPase subunit
LFGVLQIVDQGTTIILITHKLKGGHALVRTVSLSCVLAVVQELRYQPCLDRRFAEAG